MEIKSISKKIFRVAPKTAENKSNQTNPFGVSFNGNMINADVFVSGAKANLAEKVSNRSKMVISTIIGSLNSFNQNISTRLNSVVSFGKRITSKTSEIWKNLNETKVVINIGNPGDFMKIRLPENGYGVKSLTKKPVGELETMFTNLAEARVRGAQ